MPLLVDDVKLNLAFGSARPYAAELNVEVGRVLLPEELAALILAERLEAFFTPQQVMQILRWFGGFLSDLDITRSKPPEVITILDYRWIVSLARPKAVWDARDECERALVDMATSEPPPEVSVAISLFAIWQRRIRGLHTQTVDPG